MLDAAFAAAERRGSPLLAVHAWQNPAAAVQAAQNGELADRAEQWRQSVADELAARVAETAARFPSVPVETAVLPGRPSATLLTAADGAQLVVVGTRSRGAVAGVLLGSTSRALTHHAPCPVMVVR